MQRDSLALAVPLAALFLVAFIAPLCVLLALSLWITFEALLSLWKGRPRAAAA